MSEETEEMIRALNRITIAIIALASKDVKQADLSAVTKFNDAITEQCVESQNIRKKLFPSRIRNNRLTPHNL